jgi:hypothetical protein
MICSTQKIELSTISLQKVQGFINTLHELSVELIFDKATNHHCRVIVTKLHNVIDILRCWLENLCALIDPISMDIINELFQVLFFHSPVRSFVSGEINTCFPSYIPDEQSVSDLITLAAYPAVYARVHARKTLSCACIDLHLVSLHQVAEQVSCLNRNYKVLHRWLLWRIEVTSFLKLSRTEKDIG